MNKITPNERAWLGRNFSGIKVISPRFLWGEIAFCAALENQDKCIILPILPDHFSYNMEREKHGFIEDRFCIAASFPESGNPVVHEIGGRLAAQAKVRGLSSPMDMHVYPDNAKADGFGKLCLGHPHTIATAIQKNPEVKEFLLEFLIPYLYFHGYWDKHEKQPWEGLHHDLGLATLQQIAYEPSRVEEYAEYIRTRLNTKKEFLSCFKDDAPLKAKDGMMILHKWLKNREGDSLLSHIESLNPPPPDEK